MTRKERAAAVMDFFARAMPVVTTELEYNNPYQLLVSVILSAQCTDKRVNITTPALFEKYADVYALAAAKTEDVYELIKSISYPNNKTRHLIAMAQNVVENFNGKIPVHADDLRTLPGVGRKTANVIVSVLHNEPAIAVDTHVFRVSARIGLTRNAKNPFQAEMQLMQVIPQDKLHDAHHWLIMHGRYVCKARKPECFNCGVRDWCMYYKKILKVTMKNQQQ